ncbi:DNA primase large subunit [Gryllus bimaculatus]|nr:DNA primase large subunit [Gryllus bimaculatus]
MDISRKKRVPAMDGLAEKSIGLGEHNHDLQLYVLPPTSTIQLAEMILEQTLPRVPSRNMDDKKSAVLHELKKQNLKTFAKLLISTGNEQSGIQTNDRIKDHLSHFIVRLAHCQSENLRNWFLNRELELFRLRFLSLNAQGVRSFLEANQLHYSPITDEEKSSVLKGLLSSTAGATHAGVETIDFYKVPFTDVLDLITTRKVYLSRGYAYIPSRDLLSVISSIFRSNLLRNLQITASSIVDLEEDERLKPLLNLHKLDFAETYDYKKAEGVVSPEDLDPLSRVSFPPCMSSYTSLYENSSCKTWYSYAVWTLLEDTILEDEFTKTMTPEKSHYLYNIRHNYGQEGKRTAYSAFSCMKILSGSVGAGDCHGCPFKHNSQHLLKQQLENYGIPLLGIQSIMDFVSQQQYQLACTKYFEITHPSATVEVIYHPNQFFEMSRKIHTGVDVPSRKDFESSRRRIKTEKVVSDESSVNNGSHNVEENDSVWDAMDVDVSLLIEEAEKNNKGAA